MSRDFEERFPYPKDTHECHVCKTPLVDGKCPENLCFGPDLCVVCGQTYQVNEEWMVYGYCPDHEGDMEAILVAAL